MKTVKEVSEITGVSVRTLHHYHAIGLLKPSKLTEAGYRLYDDRALSRLQSILLFRELQFPLKEIKQLLDSPGFDPKEALTEQIRLLELQQKHLGELIVFARDIQSKGVSDMGFSVFNNKEAEAYRQEAKERWGGTSAYSEYESKAADRGQDEELMALFAQLGALKHRQPCEPAVQALIKELQGYISTHYYSCTKEILHSLGEMYVGDERFKANIDAKGGPGTAAFAQKAIEQYCMHGGL